MKNFLTLSRLPIAVLATFAATGLSANAVTLINDHFDDGVVTDWVGQGNSRTISAQNITESGTVISSEVTPTQTNTHRGIVGTTGIDPDTESGGFSMTFNVSSVGGTPGANGYFIGMVADNSLFFRDATTFNFGLTFFGQDARTGSVGGFGFAYGDNNGGAAADAILGNSDGQGDVQLSSMQDGFVASMTATPTGWSYSISGLNDATGTATTFSDSDTWAAAGTDYASLFGGDDSWFPTGSLQQVAATPYSIGFDQITIETIPEPSAAALMLLAVGGLLRRRR